METYAADASFPFSALVLGTPRPVQGGAHFTQASLGPGRPLYVQLPRCNFKQGIVTTKRGCYCDLMYDKGQAEGLVDWLLALEASAQDQIYKQRETWFHTELSRDDIESMLTPMSRLYRSGRSILIRTQLRVDRASGKPSCTVYDERESSLDISAINDNPEVTVIPLILIDGVKFSSRSFEIDVRLVQLMVLDPRPEPAAACLIRRDDKRQYGDSPALSAEKAEASTPSAPEVSFSSVEEEGQPACASAEESVQEPQEDTAMESAPASSPPLDAVPPAPVPDHEEEEEDGTEGARDDEASSAQVALPGDDGLTEVDIALGSNEESMTLRKPDEVYREIYRSARRKARQMRAAAVAALLEAEQIKEKYMLQDMEESEEEDGTDEGAEAPAP